MTGGDRLTAAVATLAAAASAGLAFWPVWGQLGPVGLLVRGLLAVWSATFLLVVRNLRTTR